MADQYNYSFDVSAFLETIKEDIATTPGPTGVMAPSKAKAKEVPELSPFEKLKTDFAKAVQGSYADPEELRRIYSERRKVDPSPTREMTLADWDAAAKRSADEVAQAREMAGITRSRTTDYAGNPPGDPNWIDRQAIVRDDMGGVAIKQSEPVAIIGERPPKVRPVGREDMLEGADLASPMGGLNRGSVRPAEEEEATTGEGLMSRGPAKRAKRDTEGRKTDAFYLNIGLKAETDHGSTPKITNDAREADLPDAEKTRDIGFGHKITASENASGKIHGIRFKNEDGTYKPLNESEKRSILEADMQLHQDAARSSGWDAKLKDIGTSWDELEEPYQNSLTSLAYNVGGGKAGRTWTNALTAAKNKDVSGFAKGLRRKDAGKNTAGMDNRVAKELYFSGLIDSLADISSELPLADSRSGVPLTAGTE